jgi:predicted ATP-binding protein involved in virulence
MTSLSLAKLQDPLSQLEQDGIVSSSELNTLVAWLTSQLNAWEFAKISQGGHTQTDVPLRRVFVDLPVSKAPADATESARPTFLANLLKAKPINIRRHRFPASPDRERNRKQLSFIEDRQNRPHLQMRLNYSATILIGGPGQGKSTLGQLACQLHRAALLRPFDQKMKSADRDLVRSFEQTGDDTRIGPLSTIHIKQKLFPLQISLPDLSTWLSQQKLQTHAIDSPPVILQFLSALTSGKECAITTSTFCKVLTNIPVLLVLDGFDEVGATADRDRLVLATNELLSYLSAHNGYAQIIATTRPQGYMGEFSRITVPLTPLYLIALTKSEALEYAERLLRVKIQHPDERKQTFERIEEATKEPATERLLTTPLQVTILSALVHQRGRAPRERWNLFFGYFAYTYARETERNTYASSLLRDYRTHIEQIHARVGLLLQVEAEQLGGAAARMPRTRLKEIIDAVLKEAGYDDEERIDLVRDIAKAAEERLVFLVEPEPGMFGFEIRSFQEFMSAWAITNGPDSAVINRLIAIVRAPMFRNVVLFSLSRFFSEGSHLRDTLIEQVIPHLNNVYEDIPASKTKSGSLLALETLEEGAALSYPKWSRQVMRIASQLMTLPASDEHRRLARAATPEVRKVLRDEIEQFLLDPESRKFDIYSLWVVLLESINLGELWALDFADQLWAKTEELSNIFYTLNQLELSISPWLRDRILMSAERICPEDFLNLKVQRSDSSRSLDWVTILTEAIGTDRVWSGRGALMNGIKLGRPSSDARLQSDLPQIPPTWLPWCLSAIYESNPSSKSLADALDACAELSANLAARVAWRTSWPLATCLKAAPDAKALLTYADVARQGGFGEFDDWKKAEQGWRPNNTTIELVDVPGAPPFTKESIKKSIPIWLVSWWTIDDVVPLEQRTHVLMQLDRLFTQTKSDYLREWIGHAGLTLFKYTSGTHPVEAPSPLGWLRLLPHMIGLLFPRPQFVAEDLWTEMMDIGLQSKQSLYPCSVQPVAVELLKGNRHPILYKLLLRSLQYEFDDELSDEDRRKLAGIVAEISVGRKDTDILLLKAYFGLLDPENDLSVIDQSFKEDSDEKSHLWETLSLLSKGESPISYSRRIRMISYILERGVDNAALYANVISRLRQVYQQYKSSLNDKSVWDSLGLKLPHPLSTQNQKEIALANSIVAIKSIEATDLCGIRNFKINLGGNEPEKGQWTIILGPNGTGKTTLLRGICLALRDPNDRAIWPRNSLSLDWIRSTEKNPSPAEATVTVVFNDNTFAKTSVRSSRNYIREISPEFNKVPVFAYGCRRGSALGGIRRQVDLSTADGPEIATLFDDAAELIHAETWLVSLHSAASDNSTISRVLETVLMALRNVLNLEMLEISEQRVWVKEHGRPKLLLSALSDGYLTNAGWFLDLLARWIALADTEKIELSENFLEQMTGVVLIDEIDLHLHPKWQVEIIKRTRELLPAMSFIATTHNPMTLVGAKADEIWMLQHENQEIRVMRGVDRPVLLTGGEIYQEYFGMDDVYPSELGEQLRRYNFLGNFSEKSAEENEEWESLQKKLSAANMLPAWQSVAENEID